MLRKYASYIVAFLLVVLVTGACLVRTNRRGPPPRRGGPVYVEKHKHKKHKHKHKKHKGKGKRGRW